MRTLACQRSYKPIHISKIRQMISTQIKDGKTIISLEPNRSATWLQTRNMILALTGFMLLIGFGWLIAGVWMILPFVFLDICVFSYFFYRVCRETYRRQLIVIDKSKVIFRSGIHRFGSSKTFSRPCYLLIHKRLARVHLDAFSLSDDLEIERIGSFLNEDDLSILRDQLSACGLIELNQQWWKREPSQY